jgi:hypothetical protein
VAAADDGGERLGDVRVNPVALSYRRDSARFQGRSPQIDSIDATQRGDCQQSFYWQSSVSNRLFKR